VTDSYGNFATPRIAAGALFVSDDHLLLARKTAHDTTTAEVSTHCHRGRWPCQSRPRSATHSTFCPVILAIRSKSAS
jgi:hypothetical protein